MQYSRCCRLHARFAVTLKMKNSCFFLNTSFLWEKNKVLKTLFSYFLQGSRFITVYSSVKKQLTNSYQQNGECSDDPLSTSEVESQLSSVSKVGTQVILSSQRVS